MAETGSEASPGSCRTGVLALAGSWGTTQHHTHVRCRNATDLYRAETNIYDYVTSGAVFRCPWLTLLLP